MKEAIDYQTKCVDILKQEIYRVDSEKKSLVEMFYHTNLQKLEDLKQTLVDLEGEDKENFDIIQDQIMF